MKERGAELEVAPCLYTKRDLGDAEMKEEYCISDGSEVKSGCGVNSTLKCCECTALRKNSSSRERYAATACV